ncbi:MAG: TIGR04255 family protein [Chloroflexota bacterium]
MPLKIKHYEDLPLKNSPLKQVICQVKFAPLLEIVQKLPTDFQSRIRGKYPNFTQMQNIGIDPSQAMPSSYEFNSPDGKTKVTLGLDSISLSTEAYSHWTWFSKELQYILSAFSQVYGAILINRIGLRYINQLTPENTKLTTPDDLIGILNVDLTCLIFNKSWTMPKQTVHQLNLEDKENELVVRMLFMSVPEFRFILDFDNFTNYKLPTPMNIAAILKKINGYHVSCYDIFRWSIKEEKIVIFKSKNS